MNKFVETLQGLGTAFVENAGFVIVSILCVVALILAAKTGECIADIKNCRLKEKKTQKTRRMVIIAMLSAIAVVLMLFEFPLPFLPAFYKIDASELPIVIGAFTFGPMAAVIMEFLKVLLNLFLDGTTTAFVGELANFLIGCSFVVPASMVYYYKKTKKRAALGLLLGLVVCTVAGCFLNAYLLLPTYSSVFHMDLDALVAMGTAVNGLIDSLLTFVIFATAPLNIIKCAVVSVLSLLIYKPISKFLKGFFL